MIACRLVLALVLTFCAGALLAEPPPAGAGVKRALLVGVNDYRAVPRLFGSLNDVAVMQELLVTRWGFAREHIRVLTDKAATRAGILAALNQLVQQAGPDDLVYVHYSGHGSQVEDLNGDEEDGLDETLVPQDGRSGDIPDITDDELDALFARLRSADAVIVLDSCHSGTATRALDIRTRSVPRDTRVELYRSGVTQVRAIVPMASARHVVMSAAASNQEALDGPVEGRYHGFFSYALARSIGASRAEATPREIFAGVAQQLNRIKAEFGRSSMPEPQLEAPPPKLDRPLVAAARANARIAWVEAQPLGAEQLRLVRGALLGAAVGSSWSIYGPGESAFPPGGALALATVTALRGADAVAQIQPPVRTVPPGARAVAVMAPPRRARIAIRVRDVPPERRREIEEILARDIRNVQLVGLNEPAQFVVDVAQQDIRLMTADGLQLIAAFGANSNGWSSDLARQVARVATAAELLSVDNPASLLRVSARVADAPSFATRGIALVPDVQAARYRIRRPGDPRTPQNSLQLDITVSADSYVTIVDVDSGGNVNLLFPNAYMRPDFHSQGFVRGGHAVRIPDALGAGNRAGFHWDYGPPSGVDTIRVFASTDLATATVIRERARAMQEGNVGVNVAALRRDLTGASVRGIATVPDQAGQQLPSGGDWAATSVTVQVHE